MTDRFPEHSAKPAAIEVQHLTEWFGPRDLTFTVPRGAIATLGPNGAAEDHHDADADGARALAERHGGHARRARRVHATKSSSASRGPGGHAEHGRRAAPRAREPHQNPHRGGLAAAPLGPRNPQIAHAGREVRWRGRALGQVLHLDRCRLRRMFRKSWSCAAVSSSDSASSDSTSLRMAPASRPNHATRSRLDGRSRAPSGSRGACRPVRPPRRRRRRVAAR